MPPKKAHELVKSYYQWDDILERISLVYKSVQSDPVEPINKRIKKFWDFDIATGTFFLLLTIICHMLYLIYSYLVPENEIDIAPEFNYDKSFNKKKVS